MSAELKFDMAGFNQQVAQVRNMIHRNGRSYVRTTARRLIRRMAWAAPHSSKRHPQAGRLRAGFWPAAAALGITNIYTRYPNKGEGAAKDATGSNNPAFTITNSVPYVMTLKDGTRWVDNAMSEVRGQMAKDLEKYARESWARRALLENLTAD